MSNQLLFVGACIAIGTPAMAGPLLLHVDINALSAQASGPLSESFTGTLRLANTAQEPDANARILDVLIDGVRQNTPGAASDEFSFTLDLEFDGGSIIDGRLSLALDQGGSENTYTAAAVPVQGGSILDIGGNFTIGGTTSAGVFDVPGGSLLGVGIAPWGAAAPADGRFSIIGLNPDGQGFDANADADVFVLTPAPAALSVLGLGLAMTRRRRV